MREVLNQGLIDFLKASPTPFHATASLAQRLEAAGFQHLDERQSWAVEAGGRYYVTRNDSSIIAIQLGRRPVLEAGLRLVGAHTDSPCLRVKPNPELHKQGFWQLGVEVYGGALLAPWFDRDLSLAGRVTYRRDGKVESQLIDFYQPIAVIPSLAIHLNREANQGWPINQQNELPPILAQIAGEEPADFRALHADRLAKPDRIGDAPAAVAANRQALRQQLGLAREPLWLNQVHGQRVVDAAQPLTNPDADGSFSHGPGSVCVVMTADCLPLLLTNRHGNWVAALHAGWRGLAGGIIDSALAHYPGQRHELLVWLGPCIGQQAFEVGHEVRSAFVAAFGSEAAHAFMPHGDKLLANLPALARLRLQQLGVDAIYGGQWCTHNDEQ